MGKSNKILMEIFHEQICLLHDRELNMGREDSQQFLQLLHSRHNFIDCQTHICPVSTYFKSRKSSTLSTFYGKKLIHL